MEGTLLKVNDRWLVREIKKNQAWVCFDLPLHKDDLEKELFEGMPVHFKKVEEYVEPPSSMHSNRGHFTFYAKLINKPKENSWEEIEDKFQEVEGRTFEHWLKENYNPPTKK